MLVNFHEYSSWDSNELGIMLVLWIKGIVPTRGRHLVIPPAIAGAPSHQPGILQFMDFVAKTNTSRKLMAGILARHFRKGLPQCPWANVLISTS
ncbi:UNVERIFIED_CONTAM: hypothetical protein Sradi_3170000 [Sesamum radiatum]|uniref:Uncharacterized protein n=1 Tax=Sesamum radiatum TaxID=300843 RepID=A0AAW2RE91_SESRA